MRVQNRGRIVELTKDSPGIHLREVQRRLHVSFSTVRHHVRSLEKEGAIKCERAGRYVSLFPAEMGPEERAITSLLKRRGPEAVLARLAVTGSYSNKEISAVSGLSPSAVSRGKRALLDAKVIELTDEATGGGYALRQSATLQHAIGYFRMKAAVAADRYGELWDF